jgi:CubicO group peptidase (beta-lactamase class C family)
MSIRRLLSIMFLAQVLTVSSLNAQAPVAADPLEGIWVSETSFGPELRGDLIVSRERSGWSASLAGEKGTFQSKDNSIEFAFRGGQFRGKQTTDGKSIEGFWLQLPSGLTDRTDPGGTGQPFATPVTLQRIGPKRWKGTVEPLESRFTIYLKVFRSAQGNLVAAFRNPDINSRGGASQFNVNREGSNVRFSARPDPSSPEIVHTATLQTDHQMRMVWPDLGCAVDFTRRTAAEVPTFFPRPPGTKYIYRQPEAIQDGWSTARGAQVGMDEAKLAHLVQRIIDGDPADRRPNLIHSVLVAYRGKLVLEEYFFGFDRQQVHDTRSAGKTLSSVIMGAAMRSGAGISPETRVYDLFGGVGRFANSDPRKSQITLAHLMTHTAGLACDDSNDGSPGNEGTMQTQKKEPNWWKYTLDLPMAHDPGQRYAYCSANTNLVGGALTLATKTWLPELFDRKIARPLQFSKYYWNLMPTNEGYQGGGAFLLPRDLLKVGQMYLNGGVWNGQRILDESWVKISTAPRVHISPATTGLSADEFGNYYGEGDDAYTWHLSKLKVGSVSQSKDGGPQSKVGDVSQLKVGKETDFAATTFNGYAASGNGGQLLIVVPKLELVVVFTGGNYGQGGIWGRWGSELVPQEIIPAIVSR